MDRPRDQDAARLGKLLQAGGDVDAVAVDVLAVDDHVAEVDADAERKPVLGRQGGVALAQGLLDVDSAGQRLDDAREVGQHAVTRRADDAAVVLGDEPVDDLAAGSKRACVPASSRCIWLEKPTASALRIAASLRRRPRAMPSGLASVGPSAGIVPPSSWQKPARSFSPR